MRRPRIAAQCLAQLVLLGLLLAARLAGAAAGPDLRELADEALHGSSETSRAALSALRSAGPAGMEALLARQPGAAPAQGASHTETDESWRRALDAVCAQRDCAATRIFWYTDFEQARAAALASGKPILSLRLLGRLDEEMSCANSRFFRTVLYPDRAVSRLLRERFVLHWQSVRPVPRLTIDFGDGRRLEGTITGNSIHYVLDPQGRLIDAIPGLYGAPAFRRLLEADAAVASRAAGLPDAAFLELRAQAVRLRREAREKTFASDLLRLPPREAATRRAEIDRRAGTRRVAIDRGVGTPPPSAREASRLAPTKGAVEVPVLRAIALAPAENDSVDWTGLAELHRGDATLDEASRAQLRRTYGPAAEHEAGNVIEKFERVLGLDSVCNEYLLHEALDLWLPESGLVSAADSGLDRFNDRVYAELFLTPASDPWLGLRPPDTFTGLSAVSTANHSRRPG
jgi:hypothetical protein